MILTFFMVLLLAMTTDMMPFRQRFRISGTVDLDLEPIDVPNGQGQTVVPGPVPMWPQNTCTGCAVGQTCQIFYKSCLANKDCLLMNEECKFIPCEPMKVCIGEMSQTENSSRLATEPEQRKTYSIINYSTGPQGSLSAYVAQTINMESVDALTASVRTDINALADDILSDSVAIDSTISTSARDIVSTPVAIDSNIINPSLDTLSTFTATIINTPKLNLPSTSEASTKINMPGMDLLSTSEATNINMPGMDLLSTSEATNINMPGMDLLSTSEATNINMPGMDLLSTSEASTKNTPGLDLLSTSEATNINMPGMDLLSTSEATNINMPELEVLSTSEATNINTPGMDLLSTLETTNIITQGLYVLSTSEATTINTPELDLLSKDVAKASSPMTDDSLSTLASHNINSPSILTINPSSTNGIISDEVSAEKRSLTTGCSDCPEGHSCQTVYPESSISMEECLSYKQRFKNINCPLPQPDPIDKCVPVASITGEMSQVLPNFDLSQSPFSNQSQIKASDEFFSSDATLHNFPGHNLNTHNFEISSSVPKHFGGHSNQRSATINNLDSPTEKPFNTMLYLPSGAELVSVLSTNIQDLYRRDNSISPTKTSSGQTIDPQVLITTTAKLDPCKGTCLPGQVCEKYYPPCAPPSEACLRALQYNPNVNCGWSRCNPFYICVPGEKTEVATTRKSNEDKKENSLKNYLSYKPSSELVLQSDLNIASDSESDFETVSSDLVDDINNLRTPFVTYHGINSLENSLLNSFSYITDSNSDKTLPSFPSFNLMTSYGNSLIDSSSQTESPSQLLNEIPITLNYISIQSATPPLKASSVIKPNKLPFFSLSLSTDLNEIQFTKQGNVAFSTDKQTDLMSYNTESIPVDLPKGYTAVTGDTIDQDTISDETIIQESNTELNVVSPANEILNIINEPAELLVQTESNTMMKTITPYLLETTLDIENINSLPALQTTQNTDVPTIIERTLDFNFPLHQQKQDGATDELNIWPTATQNTAPELTFSYPAAQPVANREVENEPINELRKLSFTFGTASATQTILTSSTLPDLQPSSNELLSKNDNTDSSGASETPAFILDQNKETSLPWYTFDYSKAELIEQSNSVTPIV